jgi:lipopolysaccharide exporter
MGLPVVFRRAVTAVGIYGSAALGILATIVAARELSKVDFARFALVFATVGLLQLFLDLTVEEVIVKYGNRYAARRDWPRFHRLISVGLRVKLVGGAVGAVAVGVAALCAPWIWNTEGLRGPLLVAALVPLVQAPEGMASAVLLLRNRYDVRAGLLVWSMALRLGAIAVGASFGIAWLFAAIVVAQVMATISVGVVGYVAYRRYPAAAPAPLGDDRRAIRSFVLQSSVASGLQSLRGVLPTVLVGVVARPVQVGYFRIAQAPQTAFASLSAPARLVLLAEQTKDVEHGRVERAYKMLGRYIGLTLLVSALAVPLAWIWARDLVAAVYGDRYADAATVFRLMLIVASIQVVFGWTKSFPVSIGRPGLRSAAQLLEVAALVPLVVVFGSLHGATGAAGGLIGSSVVLALFWIVALTRLRAHPRHAEAAA